MLSLILDPAGFNLQVYPSGEYPLTLGDTQSTEFNRTANGKPVLGGSNPFYDFTCEFATEEIAQISALHYQIQSRRALGLPFEIVIYNLVQPFSEVATARSRLRVPNTADIEAVPLGGGLFRYTYWIAIQGYAQFSWQSKGGLSWVTLDFEEGTVLKP